MPIYPHKDYPGEVNFKDIPPHIKTSARQSINIRGLRGRECMVVPIITSSKNPLMKRKRGSYYYLATTVLT